jgi:hypothetical protein
LDIINQVFKSGLFIDYIYRKDDFDAGLIQAKHLINKNIVTLSHITKHVLYPTKRSRVYLEILFNSNDYDNLYFLCKYREIINAIIKKYSSLDIEFPFISYQSLLFSNVLKLDFLIHTRKQTATLSNRSSFSEQESFLLMYLQHIELIQICMNIYNDYYKNSTDRKRYPLKNTFAILSSSRSVAIDSLVKDISVVTADTKMVLIAADTAKSDPRTGYKLCLSKIIYHIKYAHDHCDTDMQSCIDRSIETNSYIVSLNNALLEYIGYSIQVDYVDGLFYF